MSSGVRGTVGVWLSGDEVARLAATWTCLATTPAAACEADRVAVSSAVLRLALGALQHEEQEGRPIASSPGSAPRRQARRRARVNALLRALGRQYAEEHIRLARLAEELGSSPWSLSRALQAETGHGFSTHLNGLRVLKAAVLLRTTALSVKEVAAAVGYYPTGELDGHFRRWLRMRPGEFPAATHGRRDLTGEVLRRTVSDYRRRVVEASPAAIADA